MKKLLSVLLAICLIAGLLPVIASAAGITAKVEIISSADGTRTTLEISEGEARYMVTDANGLAHTESATASNYNIKFEWESGGVPTLYLKGAKLKASGASAKAISFPHGGAEEVAIVIEEDSTIEVAGGKNDSGATKMAFGIIIYKKHLTISGDGLLTLKGLRLIYERNK